MSHTTDTSYSTKNPSITDEYFSIHNTEETESLHIKDGGAHANAWESTRHTFLKEYGMDPKFFEHYKTQRKQAEKEFLDWKQKRAQSAEHISSIKHSISQKNNMDLWRRFDLPDDE